MEAHAAPVSRKRRRFAWDSDGSEESLDASSEGSSSRDEADESALDWESRERLHLDLQVRPSADYFELRKASVETPETEVPRVRGRGAVSRRRKRLASLCVTEGRRAALEEAARQMRGRGFVLWPDFLGKDAARRLATAMRLLRGKPGRLGSVESRSLRGDLVAWPGEADSEAIRAALGDWQQAVDRLVADLRPFLPGAVELGAVDAREPVMLSCYPRGARYIRHYDNNCDTGEGDCNGRRLTVLYYLNEAASDSDGGHLRLIGQRGGVYDILPELDALVLFWADRRTPHEVLPNLGKDRYALSCWYVDTSEAPDAPAFKMPALAESQTP